VASALKKWSENITLKNYTRGPIYRKIYTIWKEKVRVVQIYSTRKCTNRLQYNGFASARSNPQGIVFLKANLNLN
jgi:hypothetical protein